MQQCYFLKFLLQQDKKETLTSLPCIVNLPDAPSAIAPENCYNSHTYRQSPRMKRRLLLASLPFALAACGFHLKGAQRANHVHSIHLSLPNGNGELADAIRAALRQQGIAESAEAAVRVTISDIDNQRVRTTTGSTGDTQEIEIFDGFRATISENGETRGSQTFTGRSNIRYRSNTYLGSRAEEAEAHQQLARDNADKLIRYLNATIR